MSASPDGRFLLDSDEGGRGGSDILGLPLSVKGAPLPVATRERAEDGGKWQISLEGETIPPVTLVTNSIAKLKKPR